MKRLFLLFFLLINVGAFAQSISVKSFRALPMDMTASSLEGKKLDQNGEVAALIKVVTTETGFTFEGGALGVVDSQQRNGEIWVWVPRASRKITILHQHLGVLRDYSFPVVIEAERTYEMVLTTAKVETVVKEELRQQYLVFQITPKEAVLEVDEQIWPMTDGTARRFVQFGTYTYRVQAPNYYPDAGKVTVNNSDSKSVVTVNLKPNFGWVEVAGTTSEGADVYIDNALVGKAPCKSGPLHSGQHTVRVVKELYKPYSELVSVEDEQTVTLVPELEGNFVQLTLKVETDAEIWVNDNRKGFREWTGGVALGVNLIECRQKGCEAGMLPLEVTAALDGQTVVLPKPTPAYGSLNVESVPDFAHIFIDGQAMGETPNFVEDLLIDQHVLRLVKEGYTDYVDTITLAKGERKQVRAELIKGRMVRFTCDVSNAQLEIDGQAVGTANGIYALTLGNHSIKAIAPNYQDYSAALNVTEYTLYHRVSMQKVEAIMERVNVDGTLLGAFSVDKDNQVLFSMGNLQYQSSTNTWRFAEQQWDVIGENNSNVSSSYDGWIDLFGWGTSGWDSQAASYQPWSNSTAHKDYNAGGSGKNNLSGSFANADWGVYNAISNGGNMVKLWRTLTKEEWRYLLFKRDTKSGVRFVKACVNQVNGIILLPDDWNSSYYTLYKINQSGARFNSNNISPVEWTNKLESNGAVFMPVAGYREGVAVTVRDGYYWSVTNNSGSVRNDVYGVFFSDDDLYLSGYFNRSFGLSVRLVRPAQ